MSGTGEIDNGVLAAQQESVLNRLRQIIILAGAAPRRWEGIGAKTCRIDKPVGGKHFCWLADRVAPHAAQHLKRIGLHHLVAHLVGERRVGADAEAKKDVFRRESPVAHPIIPAPLRFRHDAKRLRLEIPERLFEFKRDLGHAAEANFLDIFAVIAGKRWVELDGPGF